MAKKVETVSLIDTFSARFFACKIKDANDMEPF